MGRWVKHAEDKHNIKVTYIEVKGYVTHFKGWLSPLAASESDAAHRSCPSSVMPGIGLGPAPMNMAQLNVTTWEDCRDLCCEKDDMCVSWTLALAEKTCFLREKLGKIVKQSKNLISGITKSHVLPTPHRNKKLQFYVGILSAPNNHAKVHITILLMPQARSDFEA